MARAMLGGAKSVEAPEVPTASKYVKSILACTYLFLGRANAGSSSPANTRSLRRRRGMARGALSWRWKATPAPASACCNLVCTAASLELIAVTSSVCAATNAVSCWAQLEMLSAMDPSESSTYL